MNQIQKVLLGRLPGFFDFSRIKTVSIPLCLGDPSDPDDGCHDRFNTSIEGLGHQFSDTLIIQTGGTFKNPLCDKMFNFIKESEKYLWAQRFLSIPLGWGTRAEIANAFSIIEQLNDRELKNGLKIFHPDFKVVISSNRAHMRRISWFVGIYNEHQIRVEYREARHRFGPIDTLREWVGTPLIIIKDVFLGLEHLRDAHNEQFDYRF